MDVFAGEKWLRYQMGCVEFTTKHINKGQFQWFIEIVSYLQFVTGETVYTAEPQIDKMHT